MRNQTHSSNFLVWKLGVILYVFYCSNSTLVLVLQLSSLDSLMIVDQNLLLHSYIRANVLQQPNTAPKTNKPIKQIRKENVADTQNTQKPKPKLNQAINGIFTETCSTPPGL